MSATTDALADDIVPSHRVDPTGTATLREKYAQRLRGAYDDLRAVVRRGIDERDIFGLRTDVLADVPDPPPFPFATDERKVERFMEWLERQQDRGVLEVIDEDENVWIRQAYARGVQDADRALNASGVQVAEQDLQAMFNMPVHRSSLEQLFTRNFENLRDINAVTADQIREELTDGFSRGLGPRDIARNVTDRIDKIGKHRATVLARTEVINAHADATLNRYEDFGVTRVTVRAEWLTAGDDRVCPICGSLEGEVFTTTEARTGTFNFEPGEADPEHLAGDYPVKPPSHPQCRCRLIPSVT